MSGYSYFMAKRACAHCVKTPGIVFKIVTHSVPYNTATFESLVPHGTVHEKDKFRFVFANGSVIDYSPIARQEPQDQEADLIVETQTAMVDADGVVHWQ